MKSIVRDEPEPNGKPFPKLMISKVTDVIMLMTSEDTGTVVARSDGDNQLGYYNTMWDAKNFTDFTGSVTLSND
ncbi:MAG: hypothetical protein GY761_03155 [Hyphomicrobiales bacterium]|nr:hypothetical protein [Hyphomicrobiales bacterium]